MDPSRVVRLAGQQPFLQYSDPNASIYGGSASLEERCEEGAGPADPGVGGAAVTPAGAVRPAATAMDAEQFSTGMANDLDKLLAGLQGNAVREQPAAEVQLPVRQIDFSYGSRDGGWVAGGHQARPDPGLPPGAGLPQPPAPQLTNQGGGQQNSHDPDAIYGRQYPLMTAQTNAGPSHHQGWGHGRGPPTDAAYQGGAAAAAASVLRGPPEAQPPAFQQQQHSRPSNTAGDGMLGAAAPHSVQPGGPPPRAGAAPGPIQQLQHPAGHRALQQQPPPQQHPPNGRGADGPPGTSARCGAPAAGDPDPTDLRPHQQQQQQNHWPQRQGRAEPSPEPLGLVTYLQAHPPPWPGAGPPVPEREQSTLSDLTTEPSLALPQDGWMPQAAVRPEPPLRDLGQAPPPPHQQHHHQQQHPLFQHQTHPFPNQQPFQPEAQPQQPQPPVSHHGSRPNSRPPSAPGSPSHCLFSAQGMMPRPFGNQGPGYGGPQPQDRGGRGATPGPGSNPAGFASHAGPSSSAPYQQHQHQQQYGQAQQQPQGRPPGHPQGPPYQPYTHQQPTGPQQGPGCQGPTMPGDPGPSASRPPFQQQQQQQQLAPSRQGPMHGQPQPMRPPAAPGQGHTSGPSMPATAAAAAQPTGPPPGYGPPPGGFAAAAAMYRTPPVSPRANGPPSAAPSPRVGPGAGAPIPQQGPLQQQRPQGGTETSGAAQGRPGPDVSDGGPMDVDGPAAAPDRPAPASAAGAAAGAPAAPIPVPSPASHQEIAAAMNSPKPPTPPEEEEENKALAPVDPPPPPPPPLDESFCRIYSYIPYDVLRILYDKSPRQAQWGPDFRLYDWQARCLNIADRACLDEDRPRNLVYSTPTSSGKTLVAELLGFRRLLRTQKPWMLILPFKSLCDEKADQLEETLDSLDMTVGRFYGEFGSRRILDPRTGVIVCVIEKANAILTELLQNEFSGPGATAEGWGDEPDPEKPRLRDLSAIVVDELHSVGDGERGALLEEALSKVVFAQRRWAEMESKMLSQAAQPVAQPSGPAPGDPDYSGGGARDGGATPNGSGLASPYCSHPPTPLPTCRPWIQIVGMSATLTNLRQVAAWLGAEVFESSERPVKLQRFIRLPPMDKQPPRLITLPEDFRPRDGQDALASLLQLASAAGVALPPVKVPPQPAKGKKNPPNKDDFSLGPLAKHTIDDGGSVMVFCPTKNLCKEYAQALKEYFGGPLPSKDASRDPETSRMDREDIEFRLRSKGSRSVTSNDLVDLVRHGLAFHNSDLGQGERQIVEEGFKRGFIRILCSTSTLAAGVNLPARRVIIAGTYLAIKSIALDVSKFNQMCGRAGRKGLDDHGEAVLCFEMSDLALPAQRSTSETLNRLFGDCNATSQLPKLERALMHLVGCGAARSERDLASFVRCTLSHRQLCSERPEEAEQRAAKMVQEAMLGLSSSRDQMMHFVAKAATAPQAPGAAESGAAAAAAAAAAGPAGDGGAAAEGPAAEGPEEEWRPTPLGVAAMAAGMKPKDAADIYKELRINGFRGLVIAPETCLHHIYLLTPIPSPADADMVTPTQWTALANRLAGPLKELSTNLDTLEPGSLDRTRDKDLAELMVLKRLLDMDTRGKDFKKDLRLNFASGMHRIRSESAPIGKASARLSGLGNAGAAAAAAGNSGAGGAPPPSPGLPSAEERAISEYRRRWVRVYRAIALSDYLDLETEAAAAGADRENPVQRSSGFARVAASLGFSSPKQVEELLESTQSFSGRVVKFLERMNWSDMHAALAGFQAKLAAGSRNAEILCLTEVPGVKLQRARALYRSGIRDPMQLVEASEDEIYDALRKNIGGDETARATIRGVARRIKRAAVEFVQERERATLAQGSERLAMAQAYATGISDARDFQQQRGQSGRGVGGYGGGGGGGGGRGRGYGGGRGGRGRGRGRGDNRPVMRLQGPAALPKPGQSDQPGPIFGNGNGHPGFAPGQGFQGHPQGPNPPPPLDGQPLYEPFPREQLLPRFGQPPDQQQPPQQQQDPGYPPQQQQPGPWQQQAWPQHQQQVQQPSHQMQPYQQQGPQGSGETSASAAGSRLDGPRPPPPPPQGEPPAKRPKVDPPTSGRGMPASGSGRSAASRGAGPGVGKGPEEEDDDADEEEEEEDQEIDPAALETLRDRIEFFRARTPGEFEDALREVQLAMWNVMKHVQNPDHLDRPGAFSFAFEEVDTDVLRSAGPLPVPGLGPTRGQSDPSNPCGGPSDVPAAPLGAPAGPAPGSGAGVGPGSGSGSGSGMGSLQLGLPGIRALVVCYRTPSHTVRGAGVTRVFYLPLSGVPDWKERYKSVFKHLIVFPWKGAGYEELTGRYLKHLEGLRLEVEKDMARLQAEGCTAAELKEARSRGRARAKAAAAESFDASLQRHYPIAVTFALKSQIALLLRARREAVSRGLLTRKEAEEVVPVRCDRMAVDVRLTGWMLAPHQAYVQDNFQFEKDPLGLGTVEYIKTMFAGLVFKPPGAVVRMSSLIQMASLHLNPLCALMQRELNHRGPGPVRALLSLYMFEELRGRLSMNLGVSLTLKRIELSLCYVLADMEDRGIGLNLDLVRTVLERSHAARAALHRRAQQLCRLDVDLESTESVHNMLFLSPEKGGLGLPPPPGAPRTKAKGRVSTGSEVLEQMMGDHEVIPIISLYRTLGKTADCALNLKNAAQRDPSNPGGYLVRGRFFQTSVESGRLAMADPSLQTIPKAKTFSMDLFHLDAAAGLELSPGGTLDLNLRRAFVARPGCVLVSADYAALELRVMAQMSGDPDLAQSFARPIPGAGEYDPFADLAARWLLPGGDTPEGRDANLQVVRADPKQVLRGRAKELMYGILYGMGPDRLSRSLKVTVPEAKALVESMWKRFPNLKRWHDETRQKCIDERKCATMVGRTRQLFHSGNGDRDALARKGLNTMVQGTAADLVKAGMKPLHKALEMLTEDEAAAYKDCRDKQPAVPPAALLLQIHDELVLEVRSDRLEDVARVVKESLEAADRVLNSVLEENAVVGQGPCFAVPLPVNLKVGPTWGDLVPYLVPERRME